MANETLGSMKAEQTKLLQGKTPHGAPLRSPLCASIKYDDKVIAQLHKHTPRHEGPVGLAPFQCGGT